MSIINSAALLAASGGGYQISRSVRLRASASASFSRTPVGGTRKTWTYSVWFKRGDISGNGGLLSAYVDSSNYSALEFVGSELRYIQADGGSITVNKKTSAVFRDPSAWYHVVAVLNTDHTTAEDRFRLYVNGVRVTSWSTSTDASSGLGTGYINNNTAHSIGVDSSLSYFDGLVADVIFLNGQAIEAAPFGEVDAITGVWTPRIFTGFLSGGDYWLTFQDPSAATAAAIGKDYTVNGNNWTPSNISVTSGVTYDSMIDVPTMWYDGGDGRGNYAVGNHLNGDGASWSGCLNFSIPNSSANAQGTVSVTSGKWYWEVIYSANPTSTGVQESGLRTRYTSGVVYAVDGNKYINGSATSYGSTYTTGDVIGVALDMDGSTVTFYKNNTSQGSISLSGSGVINATLSLSAGGGVASVGSVNFGQRPFSYTPPTGFKALNTQNLPDPTIKKGNLYFDVLLHAGNGGTQSLTSANFQPDFAWIKSRSSGTQSHQLFDSVRGISRNLNSANTGAEAFTSGTGLTAFNSNGITLVDDAAGNNWVNGSTGSPTYVDWLWKESVASGFDIVAWTGDGTSPRNISHSLGVVPSMIIARDRNAVSNWSVYHKNANANPQNGRLQLNATDAFASSSNFWNDTAPTSSVFTVGSGLNTNTNTLIAYLFAEVAGFSKIGGYTGNGSADGPFVYCGFRPRWLLAKRVDNASGGDWHIYDAARNPYNVADNLLTANAATAETAVGAFDFTSNGFKVRSSAVNYNASGSPYVFIAFAENPFKHSLAR